MSTPDLFEGQGEEQRPDPTNTEILRLERELTSKNRQIRELNSKVSALHQEGSLYYQLAGVIRSSARPIDPIQLRAVSRPTSSPHGAPVDAVLLLSDEHADQRIASTSTWGMERYDFDIFRCRLHRLHTTIVDYVTKHLPAHAFDKLWVFKLGDGVQGDIHESGPQNHFGNTLKASLATGDVEAQFIQSLVPYFPGGVHVVGVSGNHPRRSKRKDFTGPQDNFDYLIGEQIRTRLANEIARGRVSVHLPNAWTAYVDVRGKTWCLNHGDDVKGFAGFPWYGFDRKNNRVQAVVSRVGAKVSYFAYGHYHTAAEYPSAGARSIHSGNWTFTDPFALESLSVGSEPQQNLYVVDDRHGVVLPVPIYIRDDESESAYLRGEWEPMFKTEFTGVRAVHDSMESGSLHIHGIR